MFLTIFIKSSCNCEIINKLFYQRFSKSNLNKIVSPHEITSKHLQHIISAPSNSTTEIILQQEKQGTEGAHGSEKIERRCCFYHMCVTVCLSSSSAGCLFLGGKRGEEQESLVSHGSISVSLASFSILFYPPALALAAAAGWSCLLVWYGMYKDPSNLLYSPFLPFSSGSLIPQFPFANPSGLYTRHSIWRRRRWRPEHTFKSPSYARACILYALV